MNRVGLCLGIDVYDLLLCVGCTFVQMYMSLWGTVITIDGGGGSTRPY